MSVSEAVIHLQAQLGYKLTKPRLQQATLTLQENDMSIEIIDFSKKYWHEIPNQDNPAYQDEKIRCLMLVRALNKDSVGKDGVTVLDINNPEITEDAVLSLGHFYRKENAEIFSAAYIAELNKPKTDKGNGQMVQLS